MEAKQSKLEELEEKLAAQREAHASARSKRDEDDAEEMFAVLLAEPGRIRIDLPDVSADHPGFVVLRRPTHAEYQRFRHATQLDRSAPETVEARSKITAEMGRGCVVWPALTAYDLLVKAYPGVADYCGNEAIKLSAAGAKAAAKK